MLPCAGMIHLCGVRRAWVSFMWKMVTAPATFSAIVAEQFRPCASLTMTGRLLPPVVMLESTVASAVKLPPLPSPVKVAVDAPPMLLRSALTVIPVLAGLVPGVTTTARVVAQPGATVAGVAVATADGSVMRVGPE